jgi:WD40 repeat protein
MKEESMLHAKDIIRLTGICLIAAFIAGCGGGTETAPSPVIRSFTAVPSIISKGQTIMLSPDFVNGIGRITSNPAFGNSTTHITFGNATTIRPLVTTAYTLSVTNKLGVKVSESATVTLSPILGRFTSASRTVDARDNHTATFLDPSKVSGPNAGKVLLAGGSMRVGALHYHKTAELFDPASGTSSPTGFMGYSSASHTATLLNNGKVLVTGGWDGFRSHSDGQLYDSTTGVFTATGSMARVRSLHAATLLNNGKVLITGGYDGSVSLASAELYDPATGMFTLINPMAVARYAHTATLLNNGKVLIAGGYNGSVPQASAELYDPVTNTFSPAGKMTYARSYHTATVLSNDPNARVLIAGGATGPLCDLYDPITGTFALTGSMTTVRTYHTATLLSDSRVLLVGGSDNSAEFYDPNTRTFVETLKPMKESRGSHTATPLPNGMVLIVGGTGYINRVELFK